MDQILNVRLFGHGIRLLLVTGEKRDLMFKTESEAEKYIIQSCIILIMFR